MFADRAKIYIRSGKGGDGHVSFRRELYVPNGGPDGGDGGRGGDVIFEVDKGLNTLVDFRHKTKYKAQDGEEGGKKRCHGKDAKDLILKVPEGTVIREAETNKVIADMSGENQRQIILKGGKGGLGNMHFATSTMQVPKYAQPGKPAQELWVNLELKVIADVGLVGFPNVGKSTFLSRVTNAQPKIANYHFTTLSPNLGVVDLEGAKGFVIADIPGLIEGASEGVGLGHEFLRHVERTKMMIHVVDAAGIEGRDPVEDIYKINAELEAYNKEISMRPQVIAANKVDLIYSEDEDPIQRLRDEFEPKGIKVFPISGVTGEGLSDLLYYVNNELQKLDDKPIVFEQEYFPEEEIIHMDLPYTVEKEDDVFVVEGPKIEKMLGYTNLDSEKGFAFFQKFLKETGILEQLENAGADSICIKDMAGLLTPYGTYDLVKALKSTVDIPVQLHSHYTSGLASMVHLKGIEAGVDVIDTAMSPLAMGTSHPATESMVAALKGTEYDTGLDIKALSEIRDFFTPLREKYLASGLLDPKMLGVDANTLLYQVPGGMLSNLVSQLKQAGKADKLDEVLAEVPRVRKDSGYPPLVTPTSQIVGTQAVFNVIMGERYKMATDQTKDILRGKYGKTVKPMNQEVIDKVIPGEERITCRPADLISNEMDKLESEMAEWKQQDEDVLSYALFPQVATDYFKYRMAQQEKVDPAQADKKNGAYPV